MIMSPLTQQLYNLRNIYSVPNKAREKLMRAQLKNISMRARYMPENIYLYRKAEYPFGVYGIIGQEEFPDTVEYGYPLKNVKFTAELYDYQQEGVDKLLSTNRRCGLLCSATGSGKTAMISYLIANVFRERTLILVKNLALLHQMKEEVLKFTNITEDQIGIWGDGSKTEGDVTIMSQSGFLREGERMSKQYGTVLIDEVDCFMGDKTLDMLIPFKANRIFGFTATPYTDMYEEKTVEKVIGPITRTTYDLLEPEIIIYRYVNREEYYQDYHEKREILIETDHKRTAEQIRILQNISRERSHTLVLYDRIEMVKNVSEPLKHVANFIIGDVDNDERKKIIDNFQKNGGLLIATESTLGRGFNVPEIDTVCIFFPNKFDGRIRQMVGRALRKKKGKKVPRIYDWYDTKFYNQYKERLSAYRSLWKEGKIQYFNIA
jgi:superfamily II DNA or RNA helicase